MLRIKTVALIGAGSWGTAIAKSIAESKPSISVRVWANEKSVVNSINSIHENEFLPGIKLPPAINAYSSFKEAIEGAEVVILATPSKFIYQTAEKLARYISEDVYLGFLTKGFCKVEDEVLTVSQALERVLPQQRERIVAISGPSHAEEVSQRFHTCLTVGSKSPETRSLIAWLLTCEYLECRETDDILGVEVGGTLKNPAAIAAGMISVLPRCGDNLAGALISEALKEMIQLGGLWGISDQRMMDITGLGDLVATALSRHSRNRRFGRDIAAQLMKRRKKPGLVGRLLLRFRPKNAIERMSEKLHYLAEGAYAIEPLIELAESANISIPVYQALYEVLLNRRDPSLLIETIKNPARFNELLYSSRLQVVGKDGLENVSGKAFKDIIVARTMESLASLQMKQTGNHDSTKIIRNLREYCNSINEDEGPAEMRETRIIKQLAPENYEESIRLLAKLYAERLTDNFHSLFKWGFFLYFKFMKIANIISRKKHRIVVTGATAEITGIRRSNLLYLSEFTGPFDSMFIIASILAKGLPFPRFFISSAVVPARHFYLLKLVGGYIVDQSRLDNLLYRETLVHYLSVLAEHGIPVLYFPYPRPGKGSDDSLFRSLVEAFCARAADTVVVPVEVSYLSNPLFRQEGNHSIKDILANTAHVNFSGPTSLSDHPGLPSVIDSFARELKLAWERDKSIFPHYLLSKILAQNGNRISLNAAEELVKEYISKSKKRFDNTPSRIVKKGLNFLIKDGTVSLEEGDIVAHDLDNIEFYSRMLKR